MARVKRIALVGKPPVARVKRMALVGKPPVAREKRMALVGKPPVARVKRTDPDACVAPTSGKHRGPLPIRRLRAQGDAAQGPKKMPPQAKIPLLTPPGGVGTMGGLEFGEFTGHGTHRFSLFGG